MKEKISDIISETEISKWTQKKPVIISAQTGDGKSYFIKNKLYKYAKKKKRKILMLVHRVNCLDQFKIELDMDNKSDIITLSDYQRLENGYDSSWLDNYDYIVCDEFHYFVEDAAFNTTTDMSFQKIMKTRAIKIFMSGTAMNMSVFIYMFYDKRIKFNIYKTESDYSYINNLYMCNTKNSIHDFIKEVISKKSKAILFINNIEQAEELYLQYKDIATFNCSKANKKIYNKYVNEEEINQILRNQKFETILLITTSCMNTGINIVDRKLKYMYIDMKSIDEIIQSIGRKRITCNTDTLNLWVKNYTSADISRLKGTVTSQLSRTNELVELGQDKYKEKYSRKPDPNHIVYVDDTTGEYKYNPLMKFKKEMDIESYNQMLNYGNDGFAIVLSVTLDGISFEIKGDARIEYIEANKDVVMLRKIDRKEFIETMNFKSNGKLLKTKNSINAKMAENSIPFEIIEMDITKKFEGKMTRFRNAWKLDNI